MNRAARTTAQATRPRAAGEDDSVLDDDDDTESTSSEHQQTSQQAAATSGMEEQSPEMPPLLPEQAETPQAEFRCAYTNAGSVQGKLLLLRSCAVFLAQFFSTTRLVIEYADVAQVHKRNTALIFPNAIEFTAYDGTRYLFTSFISRDQAYAAICAVLRAHADREERAMEFSMSELSERIPSQAATDNEEQADESSASASASSPTSPTASQSRPQLSTTKAAATVATAIAPVAQRSDAQSPPTAAAATPPGSTSVKTTPVLSAAQAEQIAAPEPSHSAPLPEEVVALPTSAAATTTTASRSSPQPTAAAAAAAVPAQAPSPSIGSAVPEPTTAHCASHFPAGLMKAAEWKRIECPLPPAAVYGVFLATPSRFWHELYEDVKYTNIVCTPWRAVDGCRCYTREFQFDAKITHALVGTKSCHIRSVQNVAAQTGGTVLFATQTYMGPELPYSTAYYAESLVRMAPNSTTGGTTVSVCFRIVFVKTLLVRSVIERSATAGLYPLYEKLLARLQQVCDAQTAAAAAAAQPDDRQRRRRRHRRRSDAPAQDDEQAQQAQGQQEHQQQQGEAAGGLDGAAGGQQDKGDGEDGAQMEEKADLLRKVLRVVMIPLRTPSLVRDLLAAFLVALLVSGFVTTSLRMQIEAQHAQIEELRHQLAELRAAPLQEHALEDPDGICVAPDRTVVSAAPAAPAAAAGLTETQLAQLLDLLSAARDLADTIDQQQQQRRQGTAADTAARTGPPTGTGTKQERWTTVLVAALILGVAAFVIFSRFW